MYSLAIAITSPNTTPLLLFPKTSYNYHKFDATPPIQYNPSASPVLAVFGTRNRFIARSSLNQDKEAQISQEKSNNQSTSLLSFLCPLLRLFSAADPSGERNYLVEEATSSLSSLARFPWGSRSLNGSNGMQKINDPPQSLQLYEFEACPFCRRVREAITELDLSVEIFPCPKGSIRHRAVVTRLGGREQYVTFLQSS